MKMFRHGFTLLELMVVVAIMGLMGTISIGGYRAMRQGIEERGVMQNVNQFIRNAYQRAEIDRQPTAVYFWNETIRQESDDATMIVVGHAVAVRRAGRVSRVYKGMLVDEFGDLRFYRGTDEEGLDDDDREAREGAGMYIYKIEGNGSGVKRYLVGTTTVKADAQSALPMMSDLDSTSRYPDAADGPVAYGYLFKNQGDASNWAIGDAYGFEFADITLPANYIFGTASPKKSVKDPIQVLSDVLRFKPGKADGTIEISALRPSGDGSLKPKSIGKTDRADKKQE